MPAAALLHVPIEVAVPGVLAVRPRLVARELLDGRVVEVLAVDERLHQLQELLGKRPVAPRSAPRLEQGEPLERLAEALVVLAELLQRIDERPARAHGAQPHVDAVEVALSPVCSESSTVSRRPSFW